MFIKQNIYIYIILCHLTMYNINKPVKLQKDDLLTLEETFHKSKSSTIMLHVSFNI